MYLFFLWIDHHKSINCRSLSRCSIDSNHRFLTFASFPSAIARLTAGILTSPSASSSSGVLPRAINPNTNVCFLRCNSVYAG
jgi:hypothetical protein